jgi:hypothetical protein
VSRRVIVLVAAVTVIAAAVWVVSELNDDSAGRRGSGLRVHLSDEQAEKVEQIALDAAAVQGLAKGRDTEVTGTVVWHATEDRIIGARVEIALDPPIRSFEASVPALLEPNEDAPPGAPDLHRELRYEARNVSVLSTRIDLGSERLVAVEPAGPEAELLAVRVLGPKLKKYYYGKAD